LFTNRLTLHTDTMEFSVAFQNYRNIQSFSTTWLFRS